jgi:hypothetical protein
MFWRLTSYQIHSLQMSSFLYLFTLLIVSFAMQKLFSLMYSYLFVFVFVGHTFDNTPEIIAKASVLTLFPYVFALKSLFHFELTFVYDVKMWISSFPTMIY